MADPVAPEIKPTQAEVAAASRQKLETPVFAPGAVGDQKEAQDRLTAAVEKTNTTNDAREKDPSHFKASLEAAATPPDFTNSQMEEIATALGLNINTAGNITNELQPLAHYIEASRAALLKSSDIATELTAAGLNAVDVQKNVAKILMERGRILEKFPDVKIAFEGTGNQDALNTFIEQAFARDPRFQAQLVEVLTEIHKEAVAIEKPSEKNSQANKIREIQNDQVESLRKRLRAEGVKEPAIKLILKDIEAGDAGLTLNSTVEAIANAKGIKNIGWIDNYQRSLSALVQAEKELAQAQRSLGNESTKRGNQRNEELIASYTSQTNTFQEQVNQARTAVNTTKQSYNETFGTQTDGTITDVFTKDLQELQNARAVLNEQNGINRTINFLHTNAQRLKEAERALATESGGDAGEREKKRNEDIAKLAQRLEASVDKAMSAFLNKKYENYVSDQDILIEAIKKEAADKNKDWTVEAIVKIQTEMDDWSTFKDGKIIRNLDKIQESSKSIAEYSTASDDPVRQYLGEKLNILPNKNDLRTSISNSMFTMPYDSLTPAQKQLVDVQVAKDSESFLKDQVASKIAPGVKYEDLSPEQKTQADEMAALRTKEFEEIITDVGPKYKEKLFVELQAGFDEKSPFGRRKMNFTETELALLNKLSGDVEKKLENSGILKSLKERGLFPENKKAQILLILLLLLGGGLAATGLATVGVGAVGALKSIS